MPSRLPVLIFDFGNVVAFFDYARACENLGRRVGLSGAAFLERLKARGLMDLVQRYERGEMPCEAFSLAFCELSEVALSHDEFAAAWGDIFTLNEPVADLVARLKGQGYSLILGSNTNAIHADFFRRAFAETLAHFDALVLSYEVRHSKPSAGFYHACARAASAAPAECVFIDDMPENVAGACQAGLQGVQFIDFPRLLTSLRAFGVDVSTTEN